MLPEDPDTHQSGLREKPRGGRNGVGDLGKPGHYIGDQVFLRVKNGRRVSFAVPGFTSEIYARSNPLISTQTESVKSSRSAHQGDMK